jgi:AcrR family transcriptional regulator
MDSRIPWWQRGRGGPHAVSLTLSGDKARERESAEVDEEREPLSKGRIVECAIGLIDERGLAAITIEGLGEALDHTGMAIYRHYPSKKAILDAVLASLLAQIPPPPEVGSANERLRAFYGGLWNLYSAHPRALPLISTQALDGPVVRACLTRAQAMLTGAGFAPEEGRLALLSLTAYALGFAGLVAGGYREATTGKGGEGEGEVVLDWAAAERDYAAGLEIVLAGIEARQR